MLTRIEKLSVMFPSYCVPYFKCFLERIIDTKICPPSVYTYIRHIMVIPLENSFVTCRRVGPKYRILSILCPCSFSKICPTIVVSVTQSMVYFFSRIIPGHPFPDKAMSMIEFGVKFHSYPVIVGITDNFAREAAIPRSSSMTGLKMTYWSTLPREMSSFWIVVKHFQEIFLRRQRFHFGRHDFSFPLAPQPTMYR